MLDGTLRKDLNRKVGEERRLAGERISLRHICSWQTLPIEDAPGVVVNPAAWAPPAAIRACELVKP